MIMKKVYITFSVPYLFAPTFKIAVECENENQAREVASDVYSYDGTKYIRMRKCGKPRGREIVSYKDWWHYKW